MSRPPKLSTWPLYRDAPEDANDPDVFSAELDYPTPEWWHKANPPARVRRRVRVPSLPTRASYWKSRPLSRLLRPLPLPRESKADARRRVRLARSYASALGAFATNTRARDRVEGSAEWRVMLRGFIQYIPGPNQGPADTGQGYSASPWDKIGRGTVVNSQTILGRYYDTARQALAASGVRRKGISDAETYVDGRHGPGWDSGGGSSLLKMMHDLNLKYDGSILFLRNTKSSAAVTLEVRFS